ncbi:MAG: hypothetical protein ACM3WP_17120 [Acidobacteriota bacterium]
MILSIACLDCNGYAESAITSQLRLERTCAIMRGCRHIKPHLYTDRELTFAAKEDASGIEAYRERLGMLLTRPEVHVLPHVEIITELDGASELSGVVVVKTNMRIPYTSVFCELDCGYCNAQAEKKLRASMRFENRPRKARKRKLDR